MVSEHSRQKPRAERPNQVWGVDFVADPLSDGRRFRALTVVDVYTRECLAIEVGQSLKGPDVVRALQRISDKPGRGAGNFGDALAGGQKVVERWSKGGQKMVASTRAIRKDLFPKPNRD